MLKHFGVHYGDGLNPLPAVCALGLNKMFPKSYQSIIFPLPESNFY